MTEQPGRSRGTVVLQVLLAALFLAVIGGSVGLALGLRDRDRDDARDDARPAPAVSSQPGVPCPEEIERQADREELTQLRYVRTAQSEVWICGDGGGDLYYLGHRGGPDERPIQVAGDDWLFLDDVTATGDGYLATNTSGQGRTTYQVSREQLVIDNGDGKPEVQPVLNLDR